MRWPTLTFCRATVVAAGNGLVITRLRWIGYVGSWSQGSPTMDAVQEATHAR